MIVNNVTEFSRPAVKGKFIYNNGEKLYLKGVTYGTFAPSENGNQFPDADTVQRDFELMSRKGFNCIRTYTVPPKYLLDIAKTLELYIMVGLPWEQHVTFLDDEEQAENIINRVKVYVQKCNTHPAILCYAIGNEIPSGIVRWHGKKKIENFLLRLYRAVKHEDPESLVTYVNYPTTEYLDLHFLDFDCFNIYLESPDKLNAYLARLHNLSGDRPLVLAEVGLDSRRNGTDRQSEILYWQIKTIFSKGCAGMFIFAWTDEWWRGGFEIEDWDFGLVDRQRNPKPALKAVSIAWGGIPYTSRQELPLISVIVCTYNGSATIRDTLDGLMNLDYPNYEVIVINDGSTDNTSEIARSYPVRLYDCVNCGLSAARNKGMHHAHGSIIAYIDDDAYPDPQWLKYLAYAYETSDHACIGGPNIAPDGDGFLATCVANAPGGPVHVLLNDEIAEHVPGCNMSFKKDALMQINGFDPVFRTAGDDVDVCWRIQQSGRTIGFHPGAVVWHHRRNSFKAYWNQQKGYGKAEALLEAKWPEKYNSLGHLEWTGRIYGNGLTIPIATKKQKIFQGKWGSSLFQSIYQASPGLLNYIPLMPEWYLVILALFTGGILGFVWSPLLWCWPLFILSVATVVVQASISAKKNSSLNSSQRHNPKYRLMIIALHIIQPIARLYGRFNHGLTPWRKRGDHAHAILRSALRSKVLLHWSDEWKSAEKWLSKIDDHLYKMKTRLKHGGEYDQWDLQVNNGLFSKARGLLTIEDHGAQKQYLKFKCWSSSSVTAWILSISFLVTALIAFFSFQYFVTVVTSVISVAIIYRCLENQARSITSLESAFRKLAEKDVYVPIHAPTKSIYIQYKNGNGIQAKKNGNHKPLEIIDNEITLSPGESMTGEVNTNQS